MSFNTNRIVNEYYWEYFYKERLIWYLGSLIVFYIFYLFARLVRNRLIEKGSNIAIYGPLSFAYITGIPAFVLLFYNELSILILYNLIFIFALCSLKNFCYLNDFLSIKIKYSILTSIMIIYIPCFFIIISQLMNLSNFVIIIVLHLSLVLLSIIHLFISFRLSK